MKDKIDHSLKTDKTVLLPKIELRNLFKGNTFKSLGIKLKLVSEK